jgi:CheY-like chemotaxis protein
MAQQQTRIGHASALHRKETVPIVPHAYRIAVVESDDLIRRLIVQWLTEAGHTATAAQPDTLGDLQVDLLIANVSSPRSAAPLVRRLKALQHVPLILLSARLGRGQGASAPLTGLLGATAVLPKPFTHEELMRAVVTAMA